jgi:hypothetical protein
MTTAVMKVVGYHCYGLIAYSGYFSGGFQQGSWRPTTPTSGYAALVAFPLPVDVLWEEGFRDGEEKIGGLALVVLVEPIHVDHDYRVLLW